MNLLNKYLSFYLTSMVSVSNHIKRVPLNNQKRMAQSTFINLHPNECSHELCYYPLAVNLNVCIGSSNTLGNLSSKVCVPNETEDLNLHVFDMITGINESTTSTKHISCKCECKFDSKKWNSNQKWNNDKSRCKCKIQKNLVCAKKNYIWNPETCSFDNGKHEGIVINDSMIACDKIIEEMKTFPTKAVLTKCSSTIFSILLAFLLFNVALLITVSIYCYLIKYQAKQRPLLPCHYTISKLKETGY